uniref:Bm1415 n=1 Tax=Brugia malayi TaxID=6279 RepID=A0A0J9XYI4_BRUMA|nr:Bm1415 [Brugia malayi]
MDRKFLSGIWKILEK